MCIRDSAAFVLEWGGSTGDAREIAAQIRATHSAHEAQLLLGLSLIHI